MPWAELAELGTAGHRSRARRGGLTRFTKLKSLGRRGGSGNSPLRTVASYCVCHCVSNPREVGGASLSLLACTYCNRRAKRKRVS